VANRICQRVAGLKLPHEDSKYGVVTVNCGVSSIQPTRDLAVETLIQTADNALYQAKFKGRNGVAYLEYGEG